MNSVVKVEIVGISPLLMNRFPLVKIEAVEKKSAEAQAEIAAYRDSSTRELFVPSAAIQRCLINSSAYSKGKGRASLQKVTAACIFVSPEKIGLGVDSYEIDSRPVVVPATKGRIIKHRPKLPKWKLSFTIEFNPDLLTEQQVRRIVDDAGSLTGLLDFRPEKKGPFGRFMVTAWSAK